MGLARDGLVVLFGGWRREAILLKLQSSGYRIAAVVTPAKVTPKLAGSIERIRTAGIRVLPCQKPDLFETLQTFAGMTLLSIGFPYLVSPEILSLFKTSLNVHPTLLPHYRGPTTAAYIIINGETEAGSTVHLMDSGMDTGDIVLQRKVGLTRFDTIRSLQRKVYALEPDLVVDALNRLETPGYTPVPQDEPRATVYPAKRKPKDSEIDPARPLIALYDTIRACDPDEFPAYFYVEGQKVCIRLWRPERPADDPDTL